MHLCLIQTGDIFSFFGNFVTIRFNDFSFYSIF